MKFPRFASRRGFGRLLLMPYAEYTPQVRAERLIAACRVVLAVFSLLAIWLDPSEPAKYANFTYTLLSGYAIYAIVVAVATWNFPEPSLRFRLATHVFDLANFSVFIYLTEGPTSPFFVYFVFSLMCATLRWQWQGVLWTGAAALIAFVGIGVYMAEVLRNPQFELNRFIIRSVYLAVTGVFLGYLGSHERKLRNEISGLAAWPGQVARDLDTLLRDVLEHSARVLDAPRVLMLWEEPEEPYLNLALWSRGELQRSRESPAAYEPPVPLPLTGLSFLCYDALAPMPVVFYQSSDTVERWRGAALHADLRSRFSVGRFLSVPLHGEKVGGWLFFLDNPRFTSDDLLTGSIVAREVAAYTDLYYMTQEMQQVSAMEERVRLARDLHDGLLQSLTGAALQLEMAHRLVEDGDPKDVRERVLDVQRLLIEEHRSLRFFIQDRMSKSVRPRVSGVGLQSRLGELGARIGRQWGLNVELKIPERLDDWIPKELALHVYHIVHEAVVNAARHARATRARVEIGSVDKQLSVTVSDDGRGFSFRGHYNLAALDAMRVGPVMLKERVKSLGGSVMIDSTDSGARLEIYLPLAGNEGTSVH